jgi:hypothetical protein
MSWSAVPFGKYAGKTLPEIVVRDLDWFFLIVPKLYGKLANEAEGLARRARAIKIPNSGRKRLEVEYRYEMGHRFCAALRLSTRRSLERQSGGGHPART